MTAITQLRFLNAAHFACHYFLLIFPTAVIAIEGAWSLDYGEALALGTPIYVCFALGTLPAGWLGDRFDRLNLIGLSFAGCGGAGILIAFASDQFWLMVGLGLLGLFAAIYHPVGLALVTELSAKPGQALAMNGVFGNLGLAAAALATGILVDLGGWRSAFAIPGIAAILIAVLQFLVSKRSSPVAGIVPDAPSKLSVARDPASQFRVVAVVLLAAVFGGVVFNGVSISLPKLFDERLGETVAGLSGIGGFTALVFTIAAFAQLPVGALLDRIGAKLVLVPLFALIFISLIVLANATGLAAVAAATVSVTFMFAGLPITGWLLGRYVSLSWRSRAFAAEYVLSLGLSAVLVPAMAMLHQTGHGFETQYLLFAISAIVVAAIGLGLPSLKQQAFRQFMRRGNSPAR